jgi:CPA1 family monovalent cation:H+ antiporter
MEITQLAAALITLAAVFGYVNHRFIKLPTTIGIMIMAIVASAALVVLGYFGLGDLRAKAAIVVSGVDFPTTLMTVMLSFLLFAGALHVNLEDLARRRWTIGLLATVGLLTTVFIVGPIAWLVFNALGVGIPFIYCMIFGALIAPTDPVAVLSILRRVGVEKAVETKIVGESLFNDGVGVVVFLVLVEVATGGHGADAGHIALLFVEEVVGGIAFGLACGGVAYWMLRTVDNYQVEVLITLALVTGGYALASAIHVSGPIAMVVAGLLIGNQGRYLAMSDTTRQHLDSFWELIDEILNAVLFLLIGLEILAVSVAFGHFAAGLIMIPTVLLARLVSVSIPITVLRRFRDFGPRTIRILTWGGLHGGISVALALSVESGEIRAVLVPVTYIVVVFSIVVQGLTIGKVADRGNDA